MGNGFLVDQPWFVWFEEDANHALVEKMTQPPIKVLSRNEDTIHG
jgi:hypothetical protein